MVVDTDGVYGYYLDINETSTVRFDTFGHNLNAFGIEIFAAEPEVVASCYDAVDDNDHSQDKCGSIYLTRSQFWPGATQRWCLRNRGGWRTTSNDE